MRRQDVGECSYCIAVLTWIYRIALVLLMAGGLWLHRSLPLTQADCTVAMAAYLFMLLVLHRIYQACRVGHVRIYEMVLSQTLSNLISAGVVYLGLSIYVHWLFNPLIMLGVVAVQVLFGAVWSIFANKVYFRHYVPPRTAVVYNDEVILNQLLESPYFHEKYNVCKRIRTTHDDVPALLSSLEGCEAVFAADVSAKLANGIAKFCVERNVNGYFIPRLGHIVLAGAEYVSSFSMPILKVQRAGRRSAYRALKRGFDVFASLIGIVLTSPVMLVTALLIRMEDHGPAFYRQIRLTRDGREFSILKFRSMTVNAEKDGVARLAGANDSRITKIGHIIRACRIDELPQLFNILMGDMSIVGPRPERPEIARQYDAELPEFSLRLQVKAGLTGMAQVYGRYNTDPYHKLQMDLMYINQMSPMTDLKLIVATLKILFVKDSTAGVQDGQTTAIQSGAAEKRSA